MEIGTGGSPTSMLRDMTTVAFGTYDFPNFTEMESTTDSGATAEGEPATPAPSDIAVFILPIIYSIIGTIGIFGNGLVMIVFIANRRIFRSITDMLILNQSIMDFVVSIIFLLERIGPDLHPLTESPVLGEILCRIWDSEYPLWALNVATTQNLVLVSLERFFATCHPVIHRNNFTTRGAKFGIAGVWIYGLIYQTYWIFVETYEFSSQSCSPTRPNYTLQAVAGTVIFLVEYLLPLIVMTFAYANIILMLKRRGEVKSGGMFQRAKRNVTITLCLVFLSFVICWTLTEVTYLYYNWGGSVDLEGTFFTSSSVLVLCNMCTAPFIYTFKYEKFKSHLKRMFVPCLGSPSSEANVPAPPRIDVYTVSDTIAGQHRNATMDNSSDEPQSQVTTA